MGIDTYDLVKVTARLENGAISTFEANWVIPDSMPLTASVQMTVSGTKGAMALNTGDPIITKFSESRLFNSRDFGVRPVRLLQRTEAEYDRDVCAVR